jgi:succinylarginine dihydrolase
MLYTLGSCFRRIYVLSSLLENVFQFDVSITDEVIDMTKSFEVNFDGLVGPTHNYAGLSFGNVASTSNKASSSNPREAALQGLKKMRSLSQLGIKQALLPPQQRPDLEILKRLGFSGSDEQLLKKALQQSPELLAAVWSSSSMWTANAATVAPSNDTGDHKVHFTPANLTAKFHRSIEPEFTSTVLKKIFSDPTIFAHHPPLPSSLYFGDEGAANHTRLCKSYSSKGLHFFVYGRKAFHGGSEKAEAPRKYPARQTFEASSAIARLHQLGPDQVVFAQQNPVAIDHGVFHNDVVAVGNLNTLFYHEEAYLDSKLVLSQLQSKYESLNQDPFHLVEVPSKVVTLQEAVKSYLFNSQLISPPHLDNEMALIAPIECKEIKSVHEYLNSLVSDKNQPIREIHYFDLKQSMQNGGGPACLRLRVSLTEEELNRTHSQIFLTEQLFKSLWDWVEKRYRDRINSSDLLDPRLINETLTSLDELTQILNLGSIYPFQN